MIGLEPMISRLSVECIYQLCYTRIRAAVYIYEKLSAKTSPNLLSAAPLCDTWVFWYAHPTSEDIALFTFSSPPLGFHSVRICCTTYLIHLVACLVLRHDTYSYLAYQPNQEFLFYLGRVSQTPRTNSLFIGA